MANNIEHQDKDELVTNCDRSKMNVTKYDDHKLASNIEPLIKVIRGQQVMLDKDLATLYGVETKVLNQTVKRNIERFPNDFRFELSKEECLRSQIVTSNGRGGNRYSTYAFTEQGVAMLSSVLHSKIAVETFRLSHDRFLCIDDDVYHIGASIKDLPRAAYFLFALTHNISSKTLEVTRKSRIFAPNKYNIYIFMIMRTGDKVLISPDLTHAKDWTQGEVIEVENNPFVGIVISAKTADGNIFFGYKDLFEPVKEAVCTH